MYKFLRKILTKNCKEIPLYTVTFNEHKYKEQGKEGSCLVHFHPCFKNDKELQKMVGETIDYIRDKYNMTDL